VLPRTQVEEALEAVLGSAPVPTRYLRKHAAAAAAAEAAAAGAPGDAAGGAAVPAAARRVAPAGAADVWDLVEPEEILTKLAKREGDKPPFAKGAASEKWKERHTAFSDLRTAAGALRLAPGGYAEAVGLIRRTVMADANIAVVGEAIDAATALAKGLRRDFRNEAKLLLPCFLDKLKDKTTNCIRAIHDALSAFSAHCFSFLEVVDDVITVALDHKVAKVQIESMSWVTDCLQHLGKPSALRLHGNLLPVLLKLTDASAPAVRDAALLALAALAAAGGGMVGAVEKATAGMEPARLRKLCELVTKAGPGACLEADEASRPQYTPPPESPGGAGGKARAGSAGAGAGGAAKPRTPSGAAPAVKPRAPVGAAAKPAAAPPARAAYGAPAPAAKAAAARPGAVAPPVRAAPAAAAAPRLAATARPAPPAAAAAKPAAAAAAASRTAAYGAPPPSLAATGPRPGSGSRAPAAANALRRAPGAPLASSAPRTGSAGAPGAAAAAARGALGSADGTRM
jgi:hypothetical protein